MHINNLISIVSVYFWNIYGGTKDIDERRKITATSFLDLISICREMYEAEAIKYYKERNEKVNQKLNMIQEKVYSLLKTIVPKNYILKCTNSFSSNLHLIEDSDIDFTILIPDMKETDFTDIQSILEPYGFLYKEENSVGQPDHYYIFSKFIDGIEIEIKVRDELNSKRIMIAHQYLDNTFDEELKPYVTYLKKLLKKSLTYMYFKYMIYEYSLYMSGWKGELFGKCFLK